MKKFLIMLTVAVCLSSAFLLYAANPPSQFPILDWTPVKMQDTGEKLMCLPLEQSHMVMELLRYIGKEYKFVSSPCEDGYVYTCNVPRYAWRDNKCTVYKCNLRPY